jgi:DNA excision repair protein ERCC-2
MAVVIDSVAKTISANVRDLAAEPEFGRIGLYREGWTSFALGTKVHERVLAARLAADPVYKKEIHLAVKIPVDDWTAVVTGRIDGCSVDDSGAHIEEFKTASLVSGKIASQNARFERHRRQLLIYCDLWTRLGNRVASAKVVYVDPDTAREEINEVEFDSAQQAGKTEARLRQVLNEWKLKEKARSQKSIFADRLPFPHEAPRAGQQQLITAIRDSLETGGHLLAEATTGSGKTAAALHPALQHALRTGRQLVFLTSKTMQQTMAVRVLEAMNRDGIFRTVQLRAKEKMCANDRVFCHEDVCPYARRYPAKMEKSRILDRLLTSPHLSPENIFAEAKAEEVCPFEVQLELARNADVLVADYNYVFDPGSALTHLRDEGLRETILVIDEAHNLPDRIRKIFSPELLESSILTALAAARQLDFGAAAGRKKLESSRQLDFGVQLGDATADLAGVPQTLEKALALIRKCAGQSLPPGKDGTMEVEIPHAEFLALWEAWKPAFFAYTGWKQNHKLILENDPIVEFHFALLRFIAVLRLMPGMQNGKQAGGFASIIERRADDLRLAILCLDPSIPAAPIFQQASSAIFLSATLQPFQLFARMLGLEDSRTSNLALPSPFPPENRQILILPQVRTNFAAREKNLPKIAALIAGIDEAHDGNKLVLLPSYDFLRRIIAALPDFASESPARWPLAKRLQTQSVNTTDSERQSLLKMLAQPPPGGILLFAVLGGMFAEGVDYPGELLETVIVVSPGLPQVSFERELLRRHFDERDGNGFEHAYLQPGMTRVIQAAGRLIRTETDRGVIALICGRFLEEAYAQRLPRDWYQHSPLELISETPAQDIKDFFAGSFHGSNGRN